MCPMKKISRAEQKARLMAKAEKLIDELLEWDEQTKRPNLTQIEDKVLELRKRMSAAMAETVLEGQGGKEPVPGPKCPKCGKEMRYKGGHRNQVESRAGRLEVERGYSWCPECEQGVFPPG
jgi:DNA repair exonuclease SbcCD ATPase subunit